VAVAEDAGDLQKCGAIAEVQDRIQCQGIEICSGFSGSRRVWRGLFS
jgi:hypothetical protein